MATRGMQGADPEARAQSRRHQLMDHLLANQANANCMRRGRSRDRWSARRNKLERIKKETRASRTCQWQHESVVSRPSGSWKRFFFFFSGGLEWNCKLRVHSGALICPWPAQRGRDEVHSPVTYAASDGCVTGRKTGAWYIWQVSDVTCTHNYRNRQKNHLRNSSVAV
jgi:hypothetical protein